MSVTSAIWHLIRNPDVSGDAARKTAANNLAPYQIYIESRPQLSDDVAIVLSVEGGEVARTVNKTAGHGITLIVSPRLIVWVNPKEPP